MNKLDLLYYKLVEDWRSIARGKGCINFGPKVTPMPVVLGILQQVYIREPTANVLVVVKDYFERNNFINYITSSPNSNNNEEFKKLIASKKIVIVSDEIMQSWTPNNLFYLGVSIGINYYNKSMINLLDCSRFKLVCLTADCAGKEKLYNVCTLVGTDEVAQIAEIAMKTPVEEQQIGVVISSDADKNLIKQYDEYIAHSIQIFGDFNTMQLAKNGDPTCNVSATEICNKIAYENGWNENLDMSYDFNKQIDACYNPITLHERVELTYDIIRKRTKLISENSSKLDIIVNICKNNPDKRILIINKSSDFAKTVTSYINSNISGFCNQKRFYDACYNYHNDVDKTYLLDDNGEKVLVKSGKDKGQPKMIGAAAQMNMAEEYLLRGLTKIISTNNSPNKKLSAEFDLVIITSSLCETFEGYRYRLNYCSFTGNPIKLCQLYCFDTLEEKELEKRPQTTSHIVIKNVKNVQYDENSGVIIL